MDSPGDDEDADVRLLCAACLGESYLKSVVRKEGELGSCAFCHRRSVRGFTLEQLADRVERAFEQHYERTSDQPDAMEYLAIRTGVADFERKGDPVVEAIAMAAGLDEEPARAVAEILAERHDTLPPGEPFEETEFHPESHYRLRTTVGDGRFHAEWERVERSLRSEVRFFSRTVQEMLRRLFDDIDDARTQKGAGVIVAAGPGTSVAGLYRARAFQTRDRLEDALKRPDLEVGPPPSLSARAGRMNARGVPVFYGATDSAIALAEVRPPVGADVLIARFDILRPLRLLDVTALGQVFVEGSIFDPTLADRADRAAFLKSLSLRITRAVMPDAEDFEYLVTQAMADYLADHPSLNLDGVVFPSAQRRVGGSNVVLFHKASRCALLTLPSGTSLSVSLDPGGDPEELDDTPAAWIVAEETPAEADGSVPAPADAFPPLMTSVVESWFDEEGDRRPVSLRIDPASLIVHHVKAVRFTVEETAVIRCRREAIDHSDL